MTGDDNMTLPTQPNVRFIRNSKELSVEEDQDEDLLPDALTYNDLTAEEPSAVDQDDSDDDSDDKQILVIPVIPNFLAADLFLLPTDIFQVTISLDHPIKQHALVE